VRSRPAPLVPGSSGADLDTVIVAEALSKRYPGRPVMIFPPVLSIFERDLGMFRGRSPLEEATAAAGTRSLGAGDYDIDDDEDDDELDQDPSRDIPPPRAGPDDMFWALRDIFLRVPRGAAIGISGGPGAGKSTLLRILAGRAFPTEGRAFVRGRVAPLAADVRKALGLAAKVGGLDIVPAARLLGVEGRLAKRHRDEIEELAAPLLTPDGDPARGAGMRLAVATTVILPADVILLDDPGGLDEGFMERVGERLRERVRGGASLVFASRDASLPRELCGEVILLHEGAIVHDGDAPQTIAGSAAVDGGRTGLLEGQTPRVPPRTPPFNSAAALLSAEVQTAGGTRSKRFDSRDDLQVEIRLETAAPDTEILCGVCFTPRSGANGFRVELPEPLRIARPRSYALTARIPAGALPSTSYEIRADAIVASLAEPEPTVIARTAGRVRIQGDEVGFAEPAEPAVPCWDGSAAWPIEADWSVRQAPRRG
jgi:ABC-2 type transport system ATP-binding protein